MLRRPVLLAFSIGAILPAIAHAQPVTYRGGPIVSNPRVLPIFWRATENSDRITGFYQVAVQRLQWLNWDYHVSGYPPISNGSVLAPLTISPAYGTATSVQWNDIRDQLSLMIGNGTVPPQDAGLIYAFHFPSTTSVYLWDGRRMCNGPWGEHGSFSPWPGPGTQFPWIVVVPTCGTFDSVTGIAYHELEEELTNPETGAAPGYVNAWTANNGEVADLCEGQTALLRSPDGGFYEAARGYSNLAGCTSAEPQLDDPYGVRVMAGRSTTVAFNAGGTCIAGSGRCSATGSEPSGDLSLSISPSSTLGARNGSATIAASINSRLGTHAVYFSVTNGLTLQSMTGTSEVTVDPCGYSVCGSQCVDESSDPANCSACGNVCSVPLNGVANCTNSQCGYTCNAGYCANGGQCTSNASDPAHCGSSCTACPGPTSGNGYALCTSGQCGFACYSGYCVNGTQCTSNQSDPNHCGTSCAVCPGTANGSAICSGGSCGLQCNAGYTSCGTQCDNLSSDVYNCGACGNVCPYVGGATRTCTSGYCGFVCNSGYHSCGDFCVRNGTYCP